MFDWSGSTKSSSGGLNGIGTAAVVTRRIGARSPRHVSQSSATTAEISEATYLQGAKARTLDVWTWGKKTLAPPGSGRCAWYHSKTIRSKFPQRAGYVSTVTLEIFDPSGQTINRSFRLHP